MQPHSPAHALQAAKDGHLEDWIHAYLCADGNNVALSEGLKLQPRYWVGPLEVPLDQLPRACGPEAHMEYQENETDWEHRVSHMLQGIKQGWQPAPLIAQYTAEGVLSLRDGNHRHEALRRHGLTAYWCVMWCDTEALRGEARVRYGGFE